MKTKFLSHLIIISLLVNFINCSSSDNANNAKNIIPNPLTKVLTIGLDESIDEEFLLASPRSIAVDKDDNIYIVDEHTVKVFDKSGNPKTTFGRKGQGPGELEYPHSISIGYEGLIIVSDNKGMNIFDKYFKNIKTIRIQDNEIFDNHFETKNLRMQFYYNNGFNKYIPLNSSEIIAKIDTRLISEEESATSLIYINDDKIETIKNHNKIPEIKGSEKGIDISLVTRGKFIWDLFKDEKVIYWEPDYIKMEYSENLSYTISIVNFKNDKKLETISHSFSIASIPDSVKNQFAKSAEEMKTRNYSQAPIFAKDYLNAHSIMKNEEYYPPVKNIYVDGDYLYVITYTSNEKGEYVTDLFDLKSNTHINSFYLPFTPSIIRNNHIYKRITSRTSFSTIQKYSIDKKVFDK